MRSTRPTLALLHGWGMNARVFDALAAALDRRFEVRALNLPGHGGRDLLRDNSLAAWADDLAAQLPDGVTLLGWSLGGQVALRAALDHPGKIARLVLMASTPRFVAGPDWPHALPEAEFTDFAEALCANPEATLMRFLSLQTRGVEGQKALLQSLRGALAALPPPSVPALAAGLDILRTTDLRDELIRLRQPVQVIHGGLDTLAPRAAAAWLAAHLPEARLIELLRAGHAPHLSHPEAVVNALEACLDA